MAEQYLTIRGARQNNLRSVNLKLPKDSLIVFTGVSGSGKSSLAFETIYAEGQRRYVESLSSYARQFLDRTPKPDVDSIEGLAPAVSIDQHGTGHNPRSTVGTITEIYDYLRVLYAAVGVPHCPQCGVVIGAQSREQIIGRILALPEGAHLHILAPLAVERKGEFRDLFEDMRKQGYIRARVDGEFTDLRDDLELARHRRHNVEIVMDRGVIGQRGFSRDDRSRIAEAVELALELGEGTLVAAWSAGEAGGDLLLSSAYACGECGRSFSPPSHASFSFNSPQGMCPTCSGLGTYIAFDPELMVEDLGKSLNEGAVPGMQSLANQWRRHYFQGVADHYGFTLDTPLRDLTVEQWDALFYGSKGVRIPFHFRHARGAWEWRHAEPWPGIVHAEMQRYRKARSATLKRKLEAGMRQTKCPDCRGRRLRPESLAVTIGGLSIADVCALSIEEAGRFFDAPSLTETEALIAEDALKEVRGRLRFLRDVGLHYITLDRTAPSLAGGEAQRIRLAGQVGSGLVGVLYVLDEPSIGLHHRDNALLLRTLKDLRDMGNTVIVVEHDEDTMLAADHIVDFGPGAGEHGGEVVVSGTLGQVLKARKSLTGRYLSGDLAIPLPEQRRPPNGKVLTVRGARQNNLRNIDVAMPLGQFICVTGVSGSGKSSLVSDILQPALARDLNGAEAEPGLHDGVDGLEHLDKVIAIDQSPIGRTPRSNPATYVGVFDHIRALFAMLPESQARGYAPGRFSFNVRGGRCEACEGNGAIRLEMDFLADVWVTCEVCEGARFNRETLEVAYRGRSIADVLAMDIAQALELFANQPKIAAMLSTLRNVGMDYVRLGQPAPTLSGGEAQRVKLAKELCRKSTGRTLYILDEPTTGLHFADVRKLLDVLHRFADEGNTVIVVEHNLEVIKTADHVIDLGPEGGDGGGDVVVAGTPEEVAAHGTSHTGEALRLLFADDRAQRLRKATKRNGEAGRRPSARSAKLVRHLTVRGAREHNLRGVDACIPREKLTVFSGVSGSGKSSMALDTIYAEGQRRYVESLSAYARQFMGRLRKPKVDHVSGLSPAICIEQKQASQSPRSTVGTVTEVFDYLRALYARIGQPYCPDCEEPVGTQTSSQITARILDDLAGRDALLLAPVEPRDAESHDEAFERLRVEGFARVRVDGEVLRLDERIAIDRRRRHRVEIVVDRLRVEKRRRGRVADSVEQALDRSGGTVVVTDAETGGERAYSQHLSCPKCHRPFVALTPRSLSFNHAEGWCPSCEGLGTEKGADPRVVIPDTSLTVREGAVRSFGPLLSGGRLTAMLEAIAEGTDLDLDVPWRRLAQRARDVLLHGTGDRWFDVRGLRFQYQGLFPTLEEASRLSWYFRHHLGGTVRDLPCRACGGARLNPEAAAARVRGSTLPQVCELPLDEALVFFTALDLSERESQAAGEVLEEIRRRLQFLVDVGLEYVTLGRSAPTLSGGESQRIRLASQIGSGLTGVLYVLDEPTVGLHPRDNARLVRALENLRDLKNTLILVEHDRSTMEAADYLVDFGPGAGSDGGRVVAAGTRAALRRHTDSLTGRYLAGRLAVPIPDERRAHNPERQLTVCGARHNNLKSITVDIPLGLFVCVTGPSGSGKSSLVHDILWSHLAHKLHGARTVAGEHDAILGVEHLDKIISIDQAPIGHSPRSDPATYTQAFDLVRHFYAELPEARVRGYGQQRFSYNVAGGRCETCQGLGSRCIEMHFLPDVWVECDTCQGRRFNEETLGITYQGRSVADVLRMPIEEVRDLFAAHPRIRRVLQTLVDVGLGYMPFGQPAPTLSGGEAQRVKLARELARPGTGKTLYLLDEPTTGLHIADVERLLRVLNRLVDAGNTVIVIEHNMEVVKVADWVIDLGPGGGEAGGHIAAAGPPEVVAESSESPTAPFLAEALRRSPRAPRSELCLPSSEPVRAEQPAPAPGPSPEIRAPWERDGRQWHTEGRVLLSGACPVWHGEALDFLAGMVEALPGMGRADWSARSFVGLRPESQRAARFARVRTDEYWWFRAEFTTRKGLFDQGDLIRALGIRPFDEVEDLQVYGRWPRVRVNVRQRRWDRVTLFLWCREEIDTPAFREFLEHCYAGYREVAGLADEEGE